MSLRSVIRFLAHKNGSRNRFSTCHHSIRNSSSIDVNPIVREALQLGKPLVALESTIITHGMRWPKNIETALEVEQIVRENGAIPATIAIINGRIKVGLSSSELELLASLKSDEVIKCSRRDLPFLLSRGLTGGTTVAATMLISHMVGLKIFATGGIGGVHYQGHVTMDISADLVELGRTPIAVVCSGVKSILDIPRTLEFLETQGVCVTTYGSPECNFPDFFTTDSGCRVNYNLQSPTDAANLINSLHDLDMKSGILIGVPIPEKYAADKVMIKEAIKKAQLKATQQNMVGKEVTPFMLQTINEITKGNSLQANMALIKNNATIAAQIARELYVSQEQVASVSKSSLTNKPVPLVIGASILDMSFTLLENMPDQLNGATYRTQSIQGAGGVGRNIADGIFKLYGSTNFISLVGNDRSGETLLKLMPPNLHNHIQIDEETSTSLCSVICDQKGDCRLVLGNMEIHERISPKYIEAREELIRNTPLIIIDSNLPLTTIECILLMAKKYQKPVFFEPTDMRISSKPFQLDENLTSSIKFISPNIYELRTIVEAITGKPFEWNDEIMQNREWLLKVISSMLKLIALNFDCIFVTLGSHGVVVCSKGSDDAVLFDPNTGSYKFYNQEFAMSKEYTIRFFPADLVDGIINASGAGDSFSSGVITGMLRGYTIKRCVAYGFVAARCALRSVTAVPNQYFKNNEEEQSLLEETYKNLRVEFIP